MQLKCCMVILKRAILMVSPEAGQGTAYENI